MGWGGQAAAKYPGSQDQAGSFPFPYPYPVTLRHITWHHIQRASSLPWLQVDWDTWLYSPGLPPVTNSYDTGLATSAYSLAKAWHTSDVMGIGSETLGGEDGGGLVRGDARGSCTICHSTSACRTYRQGVGTALPCATVPPPPPCRACRAYRQGVGRVWAQLYHVFYHVLRYTQVPWHSIHRATPMPAGLPACPPPPPSARFQSAWLSLLLTSFATGHAYD